MSGGVSILWDIAIGSIAKTFREGRISCSLAEGRRSSYMAVFGIGTDVPKANSQNRWHKSAESLLAQVETSRVRLKYLGHGFLALVFMIGTLAGLAGGFLALLAFRLAGGAD